MRWDKASSYLISVVGSEESLSVRSSFYRQWRGISIFGVHIIWGILDFHISLKWVSPWNARVTVQRSVNINTWASSKAYKCCCNSTYGTWHTQNFILQRQILGTKVPSLLCVFWCPSHCMWYLHILCVWLEVKAKGKSFLCFVTGVWKRDVKNIFVCWFNSDSKYFSWLLLWYLTNIIRTIFHGTLNIVPSEDYYCSQADE